MRTERSASRTFGARSREHLRKEVILGSLFSPSSLRPRAGVAEKPFPRQEPTVGRSTSQVGFPRVSRCGGARPRDPLVERFVDCATRWLGDLPVVRARYCEAIIPSRANRSWASNGRKLRPISAASIRR